MEFNDKEPIATQYWRTQPAASAPLLLYVTIGALIGLCVLIYLLF